MSDLDDAIEQHMAHIVFEEQHPFSPNEISKDIALDQIVTHNLTIKVIVHRTDTVSVAISCSFRPTLIDLKYMIQLFWGFNWNRSISCKHTRKCKEWV